jgi:hypothetical protein
VINFGGGNRRELHIVQPKRALDQRIARNAHYLDRDQSRLRSRREISQQFTPTAGAEQVLGTAAIIILHHNTNEIRSSNWPREEDVLDLPIGLGGNEVDVIITCKEDAIRCQHEVYWPGCAACEFSRPKGVQQGWATLNSYAVLSSRSSNLSSGMATLHP